MADKLDDPIFGAGDAPIEGSGLCLSGGGYRAMLFHVGALWRLVECGKLAGLTRISSVSGGSITAGVLALAWDKLSDGDTASFVQHVVTPLRRMASVTIDERSILGGILLPGTIGDFVAKAYDKHLFGDATLQDLPDAPRFIINATNLETGSLWRFSKRENRDWRVGQIAAPTTRLADAVAASSAFPPLLSPFILDVDPDDFSVKESGVDDSYRREIALTDGGVYDNLGLEAVWKRCATVYVSDGGGRLADDSTPPGDWGRQSKRILDVIDHQVRNLRKRQVIGSLQTGTRRGAYWGIRTDIADFGVGDALPCPLQKSLKLAEEPTRLRRMSDRRQEEIINWGYAVTDAALRRYVDDTIAAPRQFPYPAAGIG